MKEWEISVSRIQTKRQKKGLKRADQLIEEFVNPTTERAHRSPLGESLAASVINLLLTQCRTLEQGRRGSRPQATRELFHIRTFRICTAGDLFLPLDHPFYKAG